MSVINLSSNGAGYGRIDTEDAILAPAFLIGSLVMSGIATIEVFGFNLADTAYSAAGLDPSWAFIISVLALAGAWVTNEPDLSKMDDEYTYIVAGMSGILVANEFWAYAHDLITTSDAIGLVVVVIMAAGFYVVSYLG
ncbi:hypothetical protein [Natrialbaceae archaeon AArc-T1-2]|uniref:hypothetical protein n=1 Tax=Natrialbaceae archaeon AArc-T1-2 TaxID=3053904 RepID=UPI00255AB847|nr:hypothetical protein [Natrialbaceae archaeon AArc-T1-2]WIV66558.1 hypothetical protein QQ977_12775 [Natrialbaceae archaeon AArc-T1-2]